MALTASTEFALGLETPDNPGTLFPPGTSRHQAAPGNLSSRLPERFYRKPSQGDLGKCRYSEVRSVVPKPIKGSFPWPGREHLSVRDRILIETRHCMDIFLAMSEIEGDPDSVVGYSEYLLMDWKWLHDPSFREKFPKYFSFHSSLLRFKEANCNYPAEIGWRGPIPRTNAVSDFIAAMLN